MATSVNVLSDNETGLYKYQIVERVFSKLDQDYVDGKVIAESGFEYGDYWTAKREGELEECNYE